MRNHSAKQVTGTRSSGHLNHSVVRYARHDRYWIPLDHPLAMGFYLHYLFVPHSRRELLGGTIARACPWMRRTSLLSDRPQREGLSEGKPCPRGTTGEPGGPPCLGGISLEYLSGLLEEHLRQAGLTLSGPLVFLTLEDYGNSTRYQTVLFLFDRTSPVPWAVMKVTRHTDQRAVLEHEFKALVALHGKLGRDLRSTIPRPLAFIEPGGLTVLLETFMPGRSIYFEMRNSWYPRRCAPEHFRWAREWLVQFQKAGMSEVRLDEQVVRDHVIHPLENFQRHCHPSVLEREMIKHAMQMAQKAQAEQLPLVACQGDFWARNLILNGSTLGVVDWERFQKRSVPFSDLFMFATSYGLSFPWKLGHWAEPVAAFRATYLERSWLSQLVREYLLAYCRAMRVSAELLEVFFPVFLAERTLQEKEQLEIGNRRSELRIWRSLIQEYAHQGGSVCFG